MYCQIKLTNQYTEHVGALQNRRTVAIIRSVSLPLVLHGASWAMIPWADHVLNYIPICQIVSGGFLSLRAGDQVKD